MKTTKEYKRTKVKLINEIIRLNRNFDDFHLLLLSNNELEMLLEILEENKRLRKEVLKNGK